MRELTPQLHVTTDGTSGNGALDLWSLMDTRACVVGGSRSGKTHTLYWLLQETKGHVQQLVIDREADFVALRGPYEYLVVGAEGDIPINLTAHRGVEKLIREILHHRLDTIIDLSDIDEEERHEYVARLFAEMANLPRSTGLWTPVLTLVDEAHTFAPEAGQGIAVSTHAMASLASRGAKRGFCLVAATQRLASLSNKVAALLENRLILRTADEDIERAAKMLGIKPADARKKLRTLERGTGYAYGTALSIDPELVRVPGALKVLPPKRGEVRAAPPPAPEALQQLIEQLGITDDDIRTLADAEAEIAELREQLANPDMSLVMSEAEKIAAQKIQAAQARVARGVSTQLTTILRQLQQFEPAEVA